MSDTGQIDYSVAVSAFPEGKAEMHGFACLITNNRHGTEHAEFSGVEANTDSVSVLEKILRRAFSRLPSEASVEVVVISDLASRSMEAVIPSLGDDGSRISSMRQGQPNEEQVRKVAHLCFRSFHDANLLPRLV